MTLELVHLLNDNQLNCKAFINYRPLIVNEINIDIMMKYTFAAALFAAAVYATEVVDPTSELPDDDDEPITVDLEN